MNDVLLFDSEVVSLQDRDSRKILLENRESVVSLNQEKFEYPE
jgi:hypothetical protein